MEDSSSIDPFGRWQGVRWRRLCRAMTGFVLVIPIGFSWVRNPPSGSQVLGGLLFAAIVFVVVEAFFARRMGVEVGRDGLTLRPALRRIHIPWAHVHGFQWKEAGRFVTGTKFLFVETDLPHPRRVPAGAPLRIPTVAWTESSGLPNDRLLGSFLSSPNIRSADGREAEAEATLERSLSESAVATVSHPDSR